MQINTMISQLAGGMLVSTEIFVVTLVFSPWSSDRLRQNVEE